MKKILSLILAVIFCFSCSAGLLSCSNKNKGENDVIPKKDTNIIENGVAVYSVVYPADSSELSYGAAVKFVEGVQEVTGVVLPLVKDSEAIKNKNEKYVLIGDTCFEQSRSVRSGLPASADAYAIELVDDYIVVAARYDSALPVAVEYYAETLATEGYSQDVATLKFIGAYNNGEQILPLGFSMKDISKCSIIYSTELEGFETVAHELKLAIMEQTGCDIPVYRDKSRVESPYEILVGKTDRELSSRVYSQKGYIMSYEVIAEKGAIQIAAGGAFSAKKCVEDLRNSVLGDGAYLMPAGAQTTLSKDLAPEVVAISQGADARIMTLNIMPDILGAREYPNVLEVYERVEIFAGMLLKYTPDVIGFQEACYKWEDQIPYYLDLLKENYNIDYDIVLHSYKGFNNYCPIMYRADKYDLDFAKYDPYTYDAARAESRGYFIRGASQVKLTEKGSDKTFIVINNHWDHGSGTSSNPTYPERTQYCADAEIALVETYKQQYPDVRIFLTGDFNNHRPHIATIFSQFVQDIGGKVASDVARESGTLVVKGGYQSSNNLLIDENIPREQMSSYSNSFIDHVVGTNGNFNVLRHDTILINYCHILTDHMPVYADIQFVK